MKLKDYAKMKINKIYHFDNMEIQIDADGQLWSHYPQYEEMWYPFYTNDRWYEKWKEKELIEGEFKNESWR